MTQTAHVPAGTATRPLWTRVPRRARTTAAIALLALVAAVAHLHAWTAPAFFSPDDLFYQAQSLQVRGQSQESALHAVFDGPYVAQTARAQHVTSHSQNVLDPAWVHYSARFYERRWVVPVLTAALHPLAGDHALGIVALLGYVLVGPLLFVLLRRRFGIGLSFVVALVCTLAPPTYRWAGGAVDMWGLVLEICCLLTAILVVERGARWLPAWALSIAALSFTHDSTIAPLAGVALLALLARNRRSVALLGVGVAAVLPALLAFPSPLREYEAWVQGGFKVPQHPTWSGIFAQEPTQLHGTLSADLAYPGQLPFPPLVYLAMAVVIAIVAFLVLAAPRRDAFLNLHRGVIPGALVYVLLANGPSAFRIELVFLPVLAVALAYAAERLGHVSSARVPRPARLRQAPAA